MFFSVSTQFIDIKLGSNLTSSYLPYSISSNCLTFEEFKFLIFDYFTKHGFLPQEIFFNELSDVYKKRLINEINKLTNNSRTSTNLFALTSFTIDYRFRFDIFSECKESPFKFFSVKVDNMVAIPSEFFN